MQNLNNLAQQIHENAKAKGFWDEPRNTGEVFMLIVSELAEALEADRKGKRASMGEFDEKIDKYARLGSEISQNGLFERAFRLFIKDTFEDEIADTVIRILDWCYYSKLEIDPFLYEKSGDFDLEKDANIGWVLFEMTKWVCKAHKPSAVSQEACLNAVLILAKNLAINLGFDLQRHIELKMQYNATREHMHGKKY